MNALVKYVEQGGILKTYDDVPKSLREQLYAEENQLLEKRNKNLDNSTIGSICPPININVLPAGSSQQTIPTPTNDATPSKPGYAELIMVHSLLDVAVEEHTEW
ncbi:hypothetical protein N7474_006913 [Penicillium riverlandense]|uniref:uncharacterized protein n=1 Tax=Penicillium riverlandense TaxID=1903569 RepID=UPI002546F4A9|nr:uncharacterized protein N7474_006913 [Penicillium riverlandense]KAJ5815136.1 hypothetical protein N7474_006913 [Penicillium riverlandense]